MWSTSRLLSRCFLYFSFSLAGMVWFAALDLAARPLQSPPTSSVGAFQQVAARARLSTVRVLVAGKQVSLGTVVATDGWILTKASTLRGAAEVQLPDGQQVPARLVGVHEPYDLALLHVAAHGLQPIRWRPSKEIAVGSWVVSVGPEAVPVAVGVISVGTRKLPPARPKPSPNSGYLGISLDTQAREARISEVLPGGGAAKAGLKANDIILAIAGKKVPDGDTLLRILNYLKPGEEVELKVKRGDQELSLRVKLGRRPLDRGEFQNRLGGELSERRSGFPRVLQHDGVLRPADCGGPLVDLQGRAVGLNICRAGRTESYAVPSEDLLRLLPDLKAGRYPPPAAAASPPAPSSRNIPKSKG